MTLADLSGLVPGGRGLLRAYESTRAQQAREQQAAAEARRAHLHYMQLSAMEWLDTHGVGPLCWVRGSGARRRASRYLPGCTQDDCIDYVRLEHAAAVCEMLGDGCGGVTAVEARSAYQTRAGRRLRAGPSEEASWVKRRCGPRVAPRPVADADSIEDVDGGGDDDW
jgi:hypothetical protein